jgi:tyrosyl-tRNA synthetase
MTTVLYTQDQRSLKAAEVLAAFEGNPRLVRVTRRALKGKPVSKLAVEYGLAESRAEASRLIKPRNSGLSVNGRPVTDPRNEIVASDLVDGHLAVIRRGTRDMVVLYVEKTE